MTTAAEPAVELQELVQDALASRTPLRIAGRSTWMDAGRPVTATRIASVAIASGVADYVPGDLTITVRGGTSLAEIARATAAEGQWFPADPFGSEDGTIGATIATGSFGPLAHSFGRIRDLVLGVEFVTGEGRIVRGGGRVVKNVAGFDLVRLISGSWGTIGIITEATLRLYSRPEQPVTLALSIPDGAEKFAQRIASVASAPVTPIALELVSASLAAAIGLPEASVILVRLGGNDAALTSQKSTLSRLGGATTVPETVWEKLKTAETAAGEHPLVFRLSTVPSRIGTLWTQLCNSFAGVDGVLMHATPGLGIIRCIATHLSSEKISAIAGVDTTATLVGERLPADLWEKLSRTVVADRLSQGILRAFDPAGILNPGIMGPRE